jgi:hypothetical protein
MGRVTCLAAAIGLLAGSSALAGVQITLESKELDSGKTRKTTMSMGPDRLRIDDGDHVILFRADQNKVLVLDTQQHTYMDISGMRDRMESMRSSMMANLSPEQREKMGAMMAQHGGPGAPPSGPGAAPSTSYEKAGAQTVGTWSCTVYHETRSGHHFADACIAPIVAAGVTEADIAALEKLGETMRGSFGGPRAGAHGAPGPRMDIDSQTKAIGFVGLPVQTTQFNDDKPVRQETFKSIEHKTLSDDLFEIPAGYTAQQMGGPMGGPPGGGNE